METIIHKIDEIERLVFNYNIKEVADSIPLLIDLISSITQVLNEQELKVLNEVLFYISTSMENKDYLLLADVLRYELIPLITNSQHFRRIN